MKTDKVIIAYEYLKDGFLIGSCFLMHFLDRPNYLTKDHPSKYLIELIVNPYLA